MHCHEFQAEICAFALLFPSVHSMKLCVIDTSVNPFPLSSGCSSESQRDLLKIKDKEVLQHTGHVDPSRK